MFRLEILKDNKVEKKYETDKVLWGVYMEAVKLAESQEDMTISEQFESVQRFIKKIFPSIKDEELERVDSQQMFDVFAQIMEVANNIDGATTKNAQREK